MEIIFQLCDNAAMQDDTVGELIRQRRNAAGLTQKELGEEIDKSDRIISEWETGRRNPGRDAIDAMSRLFKISSDEFFRRMRPSLSSRNPDLDEVLIELHNQRNSDGHAEHRLRVMQIAEHLIDHPELFAEWLHYGEYLIDKRQGHT